MADNNFNDLLNRIEQLEKKVDAHRSAFNQCISSAFTRIDQYKEELNKKIKEIGPIERR